ncbi:protein kinase domain-containing protein [Citrus sinensis]|uniref:Protein kinase domain-containing protein n=1 Tax=Citrus sinensis TaxID=2711 RepID=A0ACB8JJA6_CITSI|nr:protein kinase domain-containing protein [Citrus sinensis]
MGCIQAKLSPPQNVVERLKMEGGYVKGVSAGRVVVQKAVGKENGKVSRHGGDGNGVGERVRNGGGDGGSRSRKSVKKKISEDELVDGWPKWLVDNIPKEVLAGLVPKSADSYDKLAKVGQGTYSNVYKARDRDTGKIVALKKVRFDTSEPESVKFMAREIRILQKLDHPNVIKLEGLATSRMQYSLYLVFDFMQSDLTKIICRPGQKLTEPQVKCYMQQLLSGLQHCHERGILHRDIKASNLLIDKSGMLKIADFGLSNFFIPKQKGPLTSRVVTLWYRAPELLLGSTDYGVGIDLWSAGCLLAEMFIGRPLMPGRTEVEQLHRIFKLCGTPSEDYWKKMKLTTTFRPQHYKPSFREVFGEFPPSSYGILTTLLALDPAYRGTAASALQNEFFNASPLACDLSSLPVICREEDEPARTSRRKKRRSSKGRKSTQSIHEGHHKRVSSVSSADETKGETESSKELEKNADPSARSSSHSLKSIIHEAGLHISLSPIRRTLRNRSTMEAHHNKNIQNFNLTEGHPNALMNIQNFTLLQASITDIINHREGNAFAPFSRSLSTLDFRTLDPEKITKLFGLDKDKSNENDPK